MAEMFTLEELASRLQTDLDTATANLARADATALIENYVRRSFTAQDEVTERKRLRNGKVLLREPVSTIDTVELIDGDNRLPTTWNFDGIRTLYIGVGTIINMPERDDTACVAEITYTCGYAQVPADVKAVALTIAARIYNNPGGLRSESIGAYSYTVAGEGTDVASVGLLDGERAILNRYVRQAYTVAL